MMTGMRSGGVRVHSTAYAGTISPEHGIETVPSAGPGYVIWIADKRVETLVVVVVWFVGGDEAFILHRVEVFLDVGIGPSGG
jgi:hypothetical protein